MSQIQESLAERALSVPKTELKSTRIKSRNAGAALNRHAGAATVDARHIELKRNCDPCPCCGSELKNQRPHVDENTSYFILGGRAIRLAPKQKDLLAALLIAYPRTASHDHLIASLWSQHEPEDAANNLKVFVSQVRTRLEGTGVEIRNVQSVGYRVDFT